jgi:hypothetical protein
VTYKAITKADLMGMAWKDKGYVYIVKCINHQKDLQE